MDIILKQKFASYCCEKISETYMNSQISKLWLLLLFSLFHCYVIGIKAYMIRVPFDKCYVFLNSSAAKMMMNQGGMAVGR